MFATISSEAVSPDCRQLNVCGGVIAPPFSKGMRKKNFLGRMNEEIPMKKTRFTEAQIMDLP